MAARKAKPVIYDSDDEPELVPKAAETGKTVKAPKGGSKKTNGSPSDPANHRDAVRFYLSGKVENNVFQAPTLYILDASGKYRTWQLFVAIKHKGKFLDPEDYISREPLPDGAIAAHWSISGQEGTTKPLRSQDKEVTKGKSVGRSNFTTPFTQALLDARSDYDHRILKGSVTDKSHLRKEAVNSMADLARDAHRGEFYWRVYPMRIHDVNKGKRWESLKWPLFIQPKLDGILFLLVSVPPLPTSSASPEGEDDEIAQIKAKLKTAHPPAPRIDGFSPTREEYTSQPHILEEAATLLAPYPGLYLVGELWRQGMTLQDISGAGRRGAASSRGAAEQVFFNVFDCFYVDKPTWPVEERRALLEQVFRLTEASPSAAASSASPLPRSVQKTGEQKTGEQKTEEEEETGGELQRRLYDDLFTFPAGTADTAAGADTTPEHWIRLVPQWKVDNRDAATKLYQRFVKAGLEGAVLRQPGAPYEFGINKEKRSTQTLKWKPRPDEEWPLVGFTDGVGKEKGAVVWICASRDPRERRENSENSENQDDLVSRKTFTVTPNMDYARRQAIYARLSQDRDPGETDAPARNNPFRRLYGAAYTVQYSILSKDKLPQQPKGLRFRDPAVEALVQGWATGGGEDEEEGESAKSESGEDA